MYNGLSQVYHIKPKGESISLQRVKGWIPRSSRGSKWAELGSYHIQLTISLPNFWGKVLLSAKYILGNVTTEGQAV